MTDQSIDNEHPMEALLESYLGFDVPKAGDIRDGYVVSRRNNEIMVDIGAKSEGIIPGAELDQLDSDQLDYLSVGQEVRVYVVNPEDERGNIILSYIKVAEEEDWQRSTKLMGSRETIQCRIVGYNRGGVLVRFGTLRGFVPASQLGTDNQIDRSQATDVQLRALVGKSATLRVLESDRDRGRLIMSELEAEKSERAQRRQKRLQELVTGEVYDGKVINLTDFGAFIDIGGIEGLVHTSELSWKHIRKPSDVLSVGERVKVVVVEIEYARSRITLSMKQLEPNPWDKIEELYHIGQLVEVTVTQLTHYGAFARINDEYRLEGLIHISELSDEHVKAPNEVVDKGKKVTARIIRIDSEQQQIGFSIKQVFSDKYMEMDLAVSQEPDSAKVSADD